MLNLETYNPMLITIVITSALLKNADYITGQINHVVNKLEQAKRHLGRISFRPLLEQDRKQDDILAKAAKDSTETAIEVINSFMSQLIKQSLFN
ncbi:unnamed protein product [Rotaria sp. Silwood1]|nr:unnamed protein product [Rotaria sp. Silwood1]CAF4978307.1 unnamed protein product [Rotaria sp. Silwood1]